MRHDRTAPSDIFDDLPSAACWLHQDLRSGFEVAFFSTVPAGLRVQGTTTGFEEGNAWVVTYELELDDAWRTRRAKITTRTDRGSWDRLVEGDGEGGWFVDGERWCDLDDCLDVDMEASAMTNTFPVHRLSLSVGDGRETPAVYVRVTGRVDRLHQRYERREDRAGLQVYDYEAPAFEFRSRLVYDRAGLVVEYPGIATRVG